MSRPLLASLPVSLFAFWGLASPSPETWGYFYDELGLVDWGRDLQEALDQSDAKRPVFLLFQEIHGGAVCQNFGLGPLSHPLMVEAIEELFVPLVIYNNRPGEDAAVLARYGEPAWNNPVVRFLDPDGEDVISREEGVWQTGPLARRMVAALEAAGANVPLWLQVVTREESQLAEATFAMHCFWEGEVRLGSLSGVVETRAAWLDGREVVRVRYDPSRVSYERLVEEANRLQCAVRVYAENRSELDAARGLVGARAVPVGNRAVDAPDSDQIRRLRHSFYRWLPLTPMQRTKINAALGSGTDPYAWLSPGQATLLAHIKDVLSLHPKSLEGLEAPEEIAEFRPYLGRLEALLGELAPR